ncbi:MAG: YbaK/EbsC family protein [Candidatus Dojkabacteria bacterium]|nr:YbaK/EbsC family protein [Candidatus Dojkabacteria bacterium]
MNIFLEYIKQNNIKLEIQTFTETTHTAEEAAARLGIEVGQIVKSLLFKTNETNTPIMILTSGKNRANLEVIENLLNEKLDKPDADYVKEVTGFSIGAVTPFGHKTELKTFIDSDLLTYDEVSAAAGDRFSVFMIEPDILTEIINGEVVKF